MASHSAPMCINNSCHNKYLLMTSGVLHRKQWLSTKNRADTDYQTAEGRRSSKRDRAKRMTSLMECKVGVVLWRLWCHFDGRSCWRPVAPQTVEHAVQSSSQPLSGDTAGSIKSVKSIAVTAVCKTQVTSSVPGVADSCAG
jgi:hypothetical protein